MWQALMPMLAGAAMGAGNAMTGKKRTFGSIGQAALEGGMGGVFGGMGEDSGEGMSSLANMFFQNLLNKRGMSNRSGGVLNSPSIQNIPYNSTGGF